MYSIIFTTQARSISKTPALTGPKDSLFQQANPVSHPRLIKRLFDHMEQDPRCVRAESLLRDFCINLVAAILHTWDIEPADPEGWKIPDHISVAGLCKPVQNVRGRFTFRRKM